MDVEPNDEIAVEPVPAGDVEPGDVLLVDGQEVTVESVPRHGLYWIGEKRVEGVAIDWTADASRGVMFRLAADELSRLPRPSLPGGAR